MGVTTQTVPRRRGESEAERNLAFIPRTEERLVLLGTEGRSTAHRS